VKKLIATAAVIVAALVIVAPVTGGAAPSKSDNDAVRTLATIGAALEAHGVTPCESPSWTEKAYGDRDEPKGSAIAITRVRVVVANRPCPDRAAYADEVDWERAADAYLILSVYKSKSSKAYKKQRTNDPDIFAYKRALILRPSADVLQEPFTAAMADLGAQNR
jgi:hypothetical protein